MRQSFRCGVSGKMSPNYGPRRRFGNNEKNVYEKLVDLVECHIS